MRKKTLDMITMKIANAASNSCDQRARAERYQGVHLQRTYFTVNIGSSNSANKNKAEMNELLDMTASGRPEGKRKHNQSEGKP
jgi:hypothetical protein